MTKTEADECCLRPNCRKCKDFMLAMGIPCKYSTPFPIKFVTPRPLNIEKGIACIYDPRIEDGQCMTCTDPMFHSKECDYFWSPFFDKIIVQITGGHNSLMTTGIQLIIPE